MTPISRFVKGRNSLDHLNAVVDEVNRHAGILPRTMTAATSPVGCIGFTAVLREYNEPAAAWTFREARLVDHVPEAIEGGRGSAGELAWEIAQRDPGFSAPVFTSRAKAGDRVFIRQVYDNGGIPRYIFNAEYPIRFGVVTAVGSNSVTLRAIDGDDEAKNEVFQARAFALADVTITPAEIENDDIVPYIVLHDGTALVLGMSPIPSPGADAAILTAAGWIDRPKDGDTYLDAVVVIKANGSTSVITFTPDRGGVLIHKRAGGFEVIEADPNTDVSKVLQVSATGEIVIDYLRGHE